MTSILVIGDNPTRLSILMNLRSDVEIWILRDKVKWVMLNYLRKEIVFSEKQSMGKKRGFIGYYGCFIIYF